MVETLGTWSTADLPLLRAMAGGVSPRRWARLLRLRDAARSGKSRRAENESRLGVPVPEALVMSLTSRCRETCVYCAAADNGSGIDLPSETAGRVVKEAETLGTFAVILVGGEPLLRENLVFQLVDSHPDLLFLLFTGGGFVTRDVARKARAANLITLVGTDEWGRRGMRSRWELNQAGAAFGFSAVVSEEAAEAYTSRAFLSRMRSEGCRVGVFLERLPVGRAAGLGYGLSPDSRQLFRDMIRLREKESDLVLRFFPEGEDEFGGCLAAGRGVIHVSASGCVEPCPFIRVGGDSVETYPLVEILRSSFFASVRATALRKPAACSPCALLADR